MILKILKKKVLYCPIELQVFLVPVFSVPIATLLNPHVSFEHCWPLAWVIKEGWVSQILCEHI